MRSAEQKLHVVSFDVPWPDNYGGAIDVFHKLRHLHALGADITLHAFTYGRTPAPALQRYCSTVHYYPRKRSRWLLLQDRPFIVCSRQSDTLLRHLRADEAPVLLEGLHCTAQYRLLNVKARRVMVRAHNVEHDYYRQLARTEKQVFRKIYLEQEAAKLQRYEPEVMEQLPVAALSTNDFRYFAARYPEVIRVPAFHPNDRVTSRAGHGEYFLYQGNLAVSENSAAVEWLLREVAPLLVFPLVIAGQKIPAELIRTYESTRIRFEPNPTAAAMDALMTEAQVHLLPATQNTGIKLKLLNALYQGRHVLTNSAMCNEAWLCELCPPEDNAAEFAQKANELFRKPFTDSDIRHREEVLQVHASNARAASLLWSSLRNAD